MVRINLDCTDDSNATAAELSTLTMSCSAFLNVQDIILDNGMLTPVNTCSNNGRSIVAGNNPPSGISLSFVEDCSNASVKMGPDFTWTISARCTGNSNASKGMASSVTFGCNDFLTSIQDITFSNGRLNVVKKPMPSY